MYRHPFANPEHTYAQERSLVYERPRDPYADLHSFVPMASMDALNQWPYQYDTSEREPTVDTETQLQPYPVWEPTWKRVLRRMRRRTRRSFRVLLGFFDKHL